MGLRCLIGHDFGEMQTDRDRHERGDEVVAIIREYRECERCGHTRVISENKEVRSAAAGGGEAAEDAEVEEAPAAEADAGSESLEDVTAEEDDGVILEDEEPGRGRGEWPDDGSGDAAEPAGAAEPTPWPEVEGEDEGYAAEPSDGGLEGVEFSSGLTPEATAPDAGGGGSVDDGGDVIEASGASDGSGGFRRARPSPPPGGRQRSEAAETEFFCPECELTRPTEHSSLRPGDICPNCRLGYLTERER